MRAFIVASSVALALLTAGCGAGVSTVPSPTANGARAVLSGGTAPTCPANSATTGTVPFPQIPPAQVVDGPCWFFYVLSDLSANTHLPLTIDFGHLQNTVQGAIPIGATRTAQMLVYNTSKKTALTFSSISIVGANAGDFALDPTFLATALKGVPAKQDSAVAIQVTFTALAEGTRSAAIQFVSNAGTKLIPLTGAGLPNRPVIAGIGGSLHFLLNPPVVSAPAFTEIENTGGQSLQIQSASFGGANPSSFSLFTASGPTLPEDPANFAGLLIAPRSFVRFQIGLSPTAQPGDTATFIVNSNDPLTPSATVQLSVGTT